MSVQQAIPAALFAGGPLLALALWLVAFKFTSRVNRSFALVLVLRGLQLIALALGQGAAKGGDTQALQLWSHMAAHFRLALVPATGYFLVVFLRAARPPLWWVPAGFATAAALLTAAFMVDPCLETCSGPDGPRYGPLSVVTNLFPGLLGLGGLLLARQAAAMPRGHRRDSSFLLSVALTAAALLEVAILLAKPFGQLAAYLSTVEGWLAAGVVVYAAGAVPALAAVALHVAIALRDSSMRGRVAWTVVLYVAMAVALYVLNFTDVSDGFRLLGVRILRMLLPLLVAYGLVRHRLFDLDTHLRYTLRNGTVVGFVVAVVFLVSEGAQELLARSFDGRSGNTYLAIVATGVLVFLIAPLQNLGERASRHRKGRLPQARNERLQLYEDQARLVWMDGQMGRKERLMLDSLRERLGLSADEAARLERKAVG